MTVPVRTYMVKGRTNDVSLDIYTRMRKKMVFFPPHFFFDYKNVAPFVSETPFCTPFPAPLYRSQASYANKLTLCLLLNSFCTETKEPEHH